MRTKIVARIVGMSFLLAAGPALAQTTIYPILLTGTVTQAIGGTALRSACYVEHGVTTFQRSAESTYYAVITLSNITQGGIERSGQDILFFSTPTSGTIHFRQFPGLTDPAFTNFTTSYDFANFQQKIDFTILFPDCSLPIHAVYSSF